MSVKVRVCGRLEVEWDGQRLEHALVGRQSRVLFAYLTLHRDRPVRRDELVDALWAGEARPNGDALLRPLLSRVRRALGPAHLEGRSELELSFPPDTWVDWEAAHDGLRRARERRGAGDHAAAWQAARAALAIVERGLLPGFEADWIERFRGELDELRCQLLEAVALAGTHLGEADVVVAEQAARRAVELSPFRESARVALIEVLRRRGNSAEALVTYEQVRTLLRDELGALPGPELRALHAALLDGQREPAVPAAQAAAGSLPDRLAQAAAASWIGREQVLARLHEAAAQVAGGATVLVFVTGDGGIGKTRLVAELAAGLPGFDVLYGRCDEEQQFPYGPWVEALRPRLARLADDELAALLGSGAADLARLLPEIHERLPVAASAPGHGDPETERHQLFTAIARSLTRLAARRPLHLVIDDLHWADRSSLLLWRHVAGEPSLGAVLMVGTFRDTELDPGHPLPELIADLERHRELPRIALAGMDVSEVGALIGSVHDAEVDPATARAIRSETGGNPFFVKQLVRHLEEAGGNGELSLFDGLAVPQSVRDVIVRRVSRLPAGAGAVLRVAALLGRDIEFDLLAEVVDLDEDPLLDVLDAAVRGGLLVEVPSTPGRYSFAHALLRTTLEAELSRTRRARLHARIGAAIERQHAGRLDPWLDELARHFGAAGPAESARAVDYAVRAAQQATRRVAYDESVRLLRQAVELRSGEEAADPAELAGLQRALASAEARAGRWRSAKASFARSAEAARVADDAESLALAALGHSGGRGTTGVARTAPARACSRRRSNASGRRTARCASRCSRGSPSSATTATSRRSRCCARPPMRWRWRGASATARPWSRHWSRSSSRAGAPGARPSDLGWPTSSWGSPKPPADHSRRPRPTCGARQRCWSSAVSRKPTCISYATGSSSSRSHRSLPWCIATPCARRAPCSRATTRPGRQPRRACSNGETASTHRAGRRRPSPCRFTSPP
jgi:DNA-binding SARP family transcriptional activator